MNTRTPKERKKTATAEEEYLAKYLGGRRTRNSGAGLEKADARVFGKYRLESKYTGKSSYRLTALEWRDLWLTAVRAGEQPIFVARVHITGTLNGVLRLAVITQNFADTVCPGEPDLSRTTQKKGQSLSFKAWKRSPIFQFWLRYQNYVYTCVAMEWEPLVHCIKAYEKRTNPI